MSVEGTSIQRIRRLALRMVALTVTVLTLGLVEVSWGGGAHAGGRVDAESAQVLGSDARPD